jgi:acyl dehydratase
LAGLVDRTFGPALTTIDSDRVARFVAATRDDPARWFEHAPPGFVASLLFSVAPSLLDDQAAAPFTAVLIHAEQHFSWNRPFAIGHVHAVTGTVVSVRERRGLYRVRFRVAVRDDTERTVAGGTSVFLMGRGADRPPVAERPEPDPGARGRNDELVPAPLPGPGRPIPALHRSAARRDLQSYASATGDVNPIHVDHDAATRAGLPGTVVHGLLTASWAMQAFARFVPGPVPLESMSIRFREPLFPAESAVVHGVMQDRRSSGFEVTAGDRRVASGDAVLRE